MSIKILIILVTIAKLRQVTSEEDGGKSLNGQFSPFNGSFEAETVDFDSISDQYANRLSDDDKVKIKHFFSSFDYNKKERFPLLKDASTYCRSFKSCVECHKSVWYPCSWCHNFGCVEKAEKFCPKSQRKEDSRSNKDESCPYIQHNGPILAPAGIRINIVVKMHAIDPVIYDKEIICQLKLENRLTHLKALIIKDKVYCYPLVLKTKARGEIEEGNFKLLWGGMEPYSNEIPLKSYTCETMASNCETCRKVPSEFGCGWCEPIKSCVIGEKCADDYVKWTINRLTCQPYHKKLYYV